MEADYSTDVLLDRYPFSPLGVAGHPKNCIPCKSKSEEYVHMFLGELIQIIVDTNHYARAKVAARESAPPDKIHCPWVDVMLEEMMTFLGLVVNMSLIHKGDVREYWTSNLFQAAIPFFKVVFPKDWFLEILYNFHCPEFDGSVHRLRKVLCLVQHLSQQYQRFYVLEREICVDESIIGFQGRTSAI